MHAHARTPVSIFLRPVIQVSNPFLPVVIIIELSIEREKPLLHDVKC